MQEIRIRSVLTCETRNGVCGKLLRPRSGARHAGQSRRGCRRHRRAVDRRARHAAHHAHLPYRRHGAGGRLVLHRDRTSRARSRSATATSSATARDRLVAMTRNMAVIVTDEDGKELATYKIIQGAHLKVDEGDTIKRGQRLAEWDPYTRPILTEVDGLGRFRGSDRRPVGQRADRRDDRHHPPRHHRLARASEGLEPESGADHQGQEGQGAQAAARRRGALSALGGGHSLRRAGPEHEGGRRAGAYSAGIGQDARHHRRSAACCRAVRGAPSEGHAIIAEMSGTVEFGRDYKNKRRITIVPDEENLEPSRIPHSEGQASERSGRRPDREGRVHHRRPSGPARHSGDQGRGGAGLLPRQ